MTTLEQPLSWNQANHPLSEQLSNRAESMYAPLARDAMRPSLDELPGVRDYDRQEGLVFYEDGSQSSIKAAFARFATQTSMGNHQ